MFELLEVEASLTLVTRQSEESEKSVLRTRPVLSPEYTKPRLPGNLRGLQVNLTPTQLLRNSLQAF